MGDLIHNLTGTGPTMVALILGLVVLASFVRGLTGFGMAIIMVPLLSLVIAPERAVLLAILVAVLIGPMGYLKASREVDHKTIRLLVISAVVVTPLGFMLLANMPPEVARVAIALLAVGSCVVIMRKRPALPPSGRTPVVLVGVAAGFLGSFAAMPGPPIVHYYVRDGVPVSVSRASMVVVFFWGALATAAVAVIGGRIAPQLAALACLMLPGLLFGNWLGERFFGRIGEHTWRWSIFALLALSAGAALWRLVDR